jgi:hypothetical protein
MVIEYTFKIFRLMRSSCSCLSFIVLLLLLFAVDRPAFSQSRKTYNLVTDFGAKGDDRTDNYAAFINAAATLSKAGGGTLIIPKGKYYIAAFKIYGGNDKNNITDIIFKNCNNLVIEGNNSTIRVNGKFTRKPGYSVTGLSHQYSYYSTVCPFFFSGCKNTVLKNITLYGEVDKMKKEGNVVEGQSYGVSIYDNDGESSYNVTLQNLVVHHFAVDGFLIRSNGSKLSILNCRSYNNARQGLSITKGKDILIYGSDFDSTGFTGSYGFHWPAAGIDIENEFKPGDVNGVVIRKCQLRSNYGFQVVTTLPSHNVLIDSCFIMDKDKGYGAGVNGVGMYSLNSTLSNNIIFGSIQVDLADQGYRGEKIQQLKNNIIYSGNRGIICSDFNRPVNIEGNILVMLPKPVETYFPYIQTTNGSFNNNIIVVNPDRIREGPPKVVSLAQYVKERKNNFWLLNKNNFTEERRKGFYYYCAAFSDVKLQDKQFFPVNDYTLDIQVPEKRFVTDAQQDKIVNTPLFSAFQQAAFNRAYLVQAVEVRKYAAGIVAATK